MRSRGGAVPTPTPAPTSGSSSTPTPAPAPTPTPGPIRDINNTLIVEQVSAVQAKKKKRDVSH